jgi:cytochrome c-type biogenesis protein CcmF
MWIGAVLITLSALISLTDRRLRIGAPSARKTPAPAAAPAE